LFCLVWSPWLASSVGKIVVWYVPPNRQNFDQLKAKAAARRAAKKSSPAVAPKAKKDSAVVPESFLKKAKAAEELKNKRSVAALKAAKAKKAQRKVIFKRAEQYAKEYQTKERETIRLKRQAKNNGNFFVAPEPKVLFVVRVLGINRMSPKTAKILQLLRLRQVHSGVFLRVNKAIMTMLKLVEPYVTYGEPNLKTVSELIYKRGFGKINKQRIPLTDNAIISKELGKHNILCIEDVIHEIVTCGPAFKEVNNFLWPFKLSSPLGGFSDKGIHFIEGGDAGNREEEINKLVRRMN